MSRRNQNSSAVQRSVAPPQPPQIATNVTVITGRVQKADTAALSAASGAVDDQFDGLYYSTGQGGAATAKGTVPILEPVIKPETLLSMIDENNILAQCIEVMEVNVDGTGHDIALIEEGEEDESQKKKLEEFFKEPFPGKSMITIRRALRRDLEGAGFGFLEVIRAADGGIVFLNHLEVSNIRLIRLDDPVPVTKTVMRGGKEQKVTLRMRERRFIQIINGVKTYFREFGSSRQIHRETGEWMEGTGSVEDRGSEILYFTVKKAPKASYGTPRWINQLPSILGSRKAEISNLEFFDAGGIPPVMIMVEGGTLGEQVRKDLEAKLNSANTKMRAAIIEAVSTSGSLDSSGNVRVKVERFGAEQQKDAMFQNYDKATEEHVRIAFRLPPLFLGKAQDYNFATAYTAYMVAEAQVFYPERDEFDSIINNTIVKALGVDKYLYRSLPLTLTDVANQLKALELLQAAGATSGEELVNTLNEITGLSIEYEEQEKPEAPPPPPKPAVEAPVGPQQGSDPTQTTAQQVGTGAKPQLRAVKEEALALVELANQWAGVLGIDSRAETVSKEQEREIRARIAELGEDELDALNSILVAKSMVGIEVDPEGLAELCGCAATM